MLFRRFGQEGRPVIILLHGGGLSDWSLTEVVALLSQQYLVITPIIDGHGEDGKTTFLSIEDSARKLINYIDTECNGRVEVIGGLSLGAQITVEVLSQRSDITEYAVIESALVYPIRGTKTLAVPTYKLCYGLISQRWFAKMQAKTLMVPENRFEQYFMDSCRTSRESLINITLSNGTYRIKEGIRNTGAKALILVGGKELGIMRRSADKLKEYIPENELYVAEGMKHGELSLMHPDQYVKLLTDFMEQ